MPAKPARARLLNPLLATFMAGMILANLGGSMFFPFLGLYLKRLGFDISAIGLYFTLAALFPLVFQVLGGWVSDRIGRLRTIAFGSVAGALGWVGILIAPAMAAPMVWFLAAEAIGSITRSLVGPSYDAFVVEQAEERNRARVVGLVHSVFMVVGIVGPPLGGVIVERMSYRTLALICAGLYWGATAIRVAMARPVGTAAQSETAAAGPGASGLKGSLAEILALAVAGGMFTWILAVDGALDVAGRMSESLLPLYLKEVGGISESPIGLLQGLSAVCTTATMYPMGLLADRRGERYPLLIGCLLSACSAGFLVFGRGLAAYAVAFAVAGISSGCFTPSLQSLIAKAVPPRLRGLAFGFLSTSLGLFSFFAPAVGALLWQRVFPGLPFLLAGALALAAAVPAWTALRARGARPRGSRRLPGKPAEGLSR